MVNRNGRGQGMFPGEFECVFSMRWPPIIGSSRVELGLYIYSWAIAKSTIPVQKIKQSSKQSTSRTRNQTKQRVQKSWRRYL